MKCEQVQDLIRQYDLLTEKERSSLEDHVHQCSSCQKYKKEFQQLNEALTIIAITEDVHLKRKPKRLRKFHFRKHLLAAALLFVLLAAGFSLTPTGSASIQQAISFLLFAKIDNMNEPLPEKNGKQKALYAVIEMNSGIILKSYSTGDKSRIEDGKGNYEIMIEKNLYSYNKQKNVFTIETLPEEFGNYEARLFRNAGENNVQYIGTDTFFGRTVDKFKVNIPNEYKEEYWFDKKFGQLLRSVVIQEGEKIVNFTVRDLKEIEIAPNSKLFHVDPPKGAKIIDNRTDHAAAGC